MRRSWKSFLLCITGVLSVIVVLQGPAAADLTAYEPFRLSFPDYANGGTGFSGPWTGTGFTTRVKSLCSLKPTISEGGSVAGDAGGFGSFADRNLLFPLPVTGTTYVSFLIQPLTVANPGDFFGLFLFPLFIGKPGHGAIGNYVIETAGGTGQIASTTPVVVGTTALLVVKIQSQAGSNSVVTLYVDPIPGQSEPQAQFVKTDLGLGGASQIEIFGSAIFDEIRIGTTFADVVPSGNHRPDEDFLGCL